MTIRAKLYTAMAVTIAGLVLTAGVGIWALSRVGDRFDGVQRAADAQALALDLKFGVTDFNGWQTAYGYDGGKSRPTFLASVGAFRKTLAQARRELTRPQERQFLDRIQAAFDDFMSLDVEAFGALKAGMTAEVRRILLGPEIANFQHAAAAAQELAAAENATAAGQERKFKDARREARRFLIVAAIVAALLVVILLVTAGDLARAAEQALAGERAEPPAAG